MSKGEIFTFILCLCVLLALTAFFVFLFTVIFKLNKKIVNNGVEDQRIIADYEKRRKKKENKSLKAIKTGVSAAIILAMSVFFVFSISINFTENSTVGSIPNVVVCKSDSMKSKNEKNAYLFDNNLNDQFETFDVLLIHKLPKENELKKYDVVVYEYNDTMVIHRIVEIEEPNSVHPNQRYFLMKGDSNENYDRFPVLYSQMKGIYKGEKADYIGSFILFTQSPAGYLCIFLVIAMVFIIPYVENKILKLEGNRLIEIGYITENDLKKVVQRRFIVVRVKKKTEDHDEGCGCHSKKDLDQK
jgi:hypothetical protein